MSNEGILVALKNIINDGSEYAPKIENQPMNLYLKALFLALIIGFVSEVIRFFIPVLKKYHIPRAFIGGIIALILGPELIGSLSGINVITEKILIPWSEMSLFLVNVIFACIFLGTKIPNFKKIFRLAIPQASLGQTLAWGQYVIGCLVTYFILMPVFNMDEKAASLIEISFQGGIGVAVGMKDTFAKLGVSELSNIALVLAPSAMIIGILSGIVLINLLHKRKPEVILPSEDDELQMKIAEVLSEKKVLSSFSITLITHLAMIGLAIYLGKFILYSLSFVEQKLLIGNLYQDSFIEYIPLFPMAMLGGTLIQFFLDKIIKRSILNPDLIKKIQALALDLVIIMAIGNISLSSLRDNFGVFILLLIAGFIWNLSAFLFFYKKLLPVYQFERGLADYGQSMGTTSIGLMLLNIVDPNNISQGKEAFGFKQLLFEPFVGGGIITGISPVLISRLGLIPFFIISLVILLIFIAIGLILRKRTT